MCLRSKGRSVGNSLIWSALGGIVMVSVFVVSAGSQPAMPENSLLLGRSDDRCFTQIWYDWQYGQHRTDSVCPHEGQCDNPAQRDSWIPSPEDPIQLISIYFTIFTDDDGDNPAILEEDLADAVDSMNAHFLPWRLQFDYDYRYIPSSQYRTLDSWGEYNMMKTLYAVDPENQCNIFVTTVYISGMAFSMGTFPWDPNALGPLGGILMNNYQMPPYNYGTLTHEMGHNLGLWHTFHGVDEVDACDICYESPQQPNNDWVGDFCLDTDPTPVNVSCFPPGGEDTCTHIEWGPTQPENHMSYAPSRCRDEFSIQQTGRMHCWLRDRLQTWIVSVSFTADTTFGPVPLEVHFTSETIKDVLTWMWDFGDGGSADVPHPSHTYNEPGLYDVSVTIEATDGSFTRTRSDYIWIYADTLIMPHVVGRVDASARFDIYARNTQPLDRIRIPFCWEGMLNLSLDSVSTSGLRTAYITNDHFVHWDSFNSRATYEIDPESGQELPPDTGAVLSLYFSCPSGLHEQTNPISILSYLDYEPLFTCAPGNLVPVHSPGELEICGVGDVDYDGDSPNIADLTYLVDYLFGGGPEPPLMVTANVDGIPPVNIADLTYLVAYLFGSGPPPVCP